MLEQVYILFDSVVYIFSFGVQSWLTKQIFPAGPLVPILRSIKLYAVTNISVNGMPNMNNGLTDSFLCTFHTIEAPEFGHLITETDLWPIRNGGSQHICT